MKLPLLVSAFAFLVLSACTETRFESPPGDKIEACDPGWKGFWVDASENANRDDAENAAFLVDQECRFLLLERPEKDGPLKQIHIPLNFVHDRGKHYLVIADNQLAGVVDVGPIHRMKPAPAKAFFIARYELNGDKLSLFDIDTTRVAHLVVDDAIDGTVDSGDRELHVFVKGDRSQILEILRKHDLFDAEAEAVARRSTQSLDEYEASYSARRERSKP
ncbi:hypothetical protein [Dokdonella sp.]|uniref:hypothetical protein n=1 Tax=Dokdonella sp. TaxID=2291710 RepID=UPI003527F478